MKKLILGICVLAFTGALQAQQVVKIVASTNSGKNMLEIFTPENAEVFVIKKDEDLNTQLLAKLVALKKAGYIQKSYEVAVLQSQIMGAATNKVVTNSREEIFYFWKE